MEKSTLISMNEQNKDAIHCISHKKEQLSGNSLQLIIHLAPDWQGPRSFVNVFLSHTLQSHGCLCKLKLQGNPNVLTTIPCVPE